PLHSEFIIHNSAFIILSFIPQRFDGVEVGGAQGGYQSAEYSHDQEDEGGDPDGAQGNVEMDVAFAGGVFIERTVEGYCADSCRQAVGQQDAQDSTHQRQHQGFRHELGLNVPPPRPQRSPQADFADALIDGHQHDVHQADAADSQRQRAHKGKESLEADGDAVDNGAELLAAEHHDGALVGG